VCYIKDAWPKSQAALLLEVTRELLTFRVQSMHHFTLCCYNLPLECVDSFFSFFNLPLVITIATETVIWTQSVFTIFLSTDFSHFIVAGKGHRFPEVEPRTCGASGTRDGQRQVTATRASIQGNKLCKLPMPRARTKHGVGRRVPVLANGSSSKTA
jgi:hypothetical protein